MLPVEVKSSKQRKTKASRPCRDAFARRGIALRCVQSRKSSSSLYSFRISVTSANILAGYFANNADADGENTAPQQEQQKTKVKAFIAAVKKNTDLRELDAAVLRAFSVHLASHGQSKMPATEVKKRARNGIAVKLHRSLLPCFPKSPPTTWARFAVLRVLLTRRRWVVRHCLSRSPAWRPTPRAAARTPPAHSPRLPAAAPPASLW